MIAAKVYNALLHNCRQPEVQKILGKNQNGFQRNRFISQILNICRIIGEVHAKNLKAILLFVISPRHLILYTKIKQIQLAYGLSKETVTTIIWKQEFAYLMWDKLLKYCHCSLALYIYNWPSLHEHQ